eukprot:TRINITY_DN6364_c0_g1_i1.p1 TRINITY_DN6364_c0_g1~~TRINITY_DN6364_c0_g1_i1.p1  ORF type:complete len:424 (+),score=62.08 TRINITY_DN6364_c0_g1_i1:1080-2351(+)
MRPIGIGAQADCSWHVLMDRMHYNFMDILKLTQICLDGDDEALDKFRAEIGSLVGCASDSALLYYFFAFSRCFCILAILLEAWEYLLAKGWSHGDLKALNIFFELDKNQIKLGDREPFICAKSDLYSIGCVLHLAVEGCEVDRTRPATIDNEFVSPALREFIENCLKPSPDDRPSLASIRDLRRNGGFKSARAAAAELCPKLLNLFTRELWNKGIMTPYAPVSNLQRIHPELLQRQENASHHTGGPKMPPVLNKPDQESATQPPPSPQPAAAPIPSQPRRATPRRDSVQQTATPRKALAKRDYPKDDLWPRRLLLLRNPWTEVYRDLLPHIQICWNHSQAAAEMSRPHDFRIRAIIFQLCKLASEASTQADFISQMQAAPVMQGAAALNPTLLKLPHEDEGPETVVLHARHYSTVTRAIRNYF